MESTMDAPVASISLEAKSHIMLTTSCSWDSEDWIMLLNTAGSCSFSSSST